MRGAALMTGSMASFTVNDAFMKLLGAEMPFFQMMFLRSAGVTFLMLLIAWRAGVLMRRVSRQDGWLILIRSGSEVLAAYFFISALIHMPIANVTAIIQALPLTVTLAAALVLGEPVGWRRFTAIGIGFIGVFLIVRPGAEGFNIWSVYALLSVVFITTRDLAVRRMSGEVSSLQVALATAGSVLLFSAIGSLFIDWVPVTGQHAGWLSAAIFMVLFGYLFSVMAMRVGDIGFVAPFRYSSLLTALLIGFFVFGDWPDALTLVGTCIVVATGLFTLWRERQAARAVIEAG